MFVKREEKKQQKRTNMFTRDFWDEKYATSQTGWDIGYPSPAIVEYFEQIPKKGQSVLIPGAGKGYEVYALHKLGFKVFYADISPLAVEHFIELHPDFPKEQIILSDFFHIDGVFDFIAEQTFFCALHPSQREDYAVHAAKLLKPKGKLIGVLFNCDFGNDYPPFGGTKSAYEALFGKYFSIVSFSDCYNSIPQRVGNEVFMKCVK